MIISWLIDAKKRSRRIEINGYGATQKAEDLYFAYVKVSRIRVFNQIKDHFDAFCTYLSWGKHT